jgi:S-disulfanyl-L-cysteine oxidoreductase SoxD
MLALGLLSSGCGRAPAARAASAPTRTPAPTARPVPTEIVVIPEGDQLARGEAVYAARCASCHGASLQGYLIGPRLDRQQLVHASGGTSSHPGTAATLYSTIAQEMPYADPGSLTSLEYYDVTAYVLTRNGMLPAATLLGPTTAAGIAVTLTSR